MRCNRCQNEDPRLFANDHGTYYCLKCISFSRMEVNTLVKPVELAHRIWVGKPTLKYELTKAQKVVSRQIVEYLESGKDVFLYAATGAGKTECVFESICAYLALGKKVCFAISRRQVVLEIAQRLRIAFPELSVVEVCQDYTTVTDADLIVCTTHQLYRYPYAFDLLILDELDAFPFVGNDLLQNIANQSCVGQKLLLSATPDDQSLKEIEEGKMEMVTLFRRPHEHLLIVPEIRQVSVWIQMILVIYYCVQFKKEHKQVLVFVPTKKEARYISCVLNLFVKTSYVHSSSENRDSVLDDFRNKKSDVLVCTTLLERGITIPSVQVIVYRADHSVFTTASLIQIYGRVGRSFNDPDGRGICLCENINDSIRDCVKQIEAMNHSACVAMKK